MVRIYRRQVVVSNAMNVEGVEEPEYYGPYRSG